MADGEARLRLPVDKSWALAMCRNVRFGSLADIAEAFGHVRFVPLADINLLRGWPATLVWKHY